MEVPRRLPHSVVSKSVSTVATIFLLITHRAVQRPRSTAQASQCHPFYRRTKHIPTIP